MPRSVNAVASRKRRKRMLAKAKGYWGRRSKVTTVAKHSVEKAGQHAYSGRKLKKRVMRNIWTVRINAAARGQTHFVFECRVKSAEYRVKSAECRVKSAECRVKRVLRSQSLRTDS